MATAIAEGFSLSHAQILDGSTSFITALGAGYSVPESGDIYGVNEASLDPDTDDYDNEGDDVVLSTWSWLNRAEVNVQAGYVSFPVIATLTGGTTSSSGSTSFGVDLWHEDSMNVAPKPMLIKMPSKDSLGAVRTLAIGLYRVNFQPITFDGPEYKEGLKINYNGYAVYSTVDEVGATFSDSKKRVGRLLSVA